MLVQCRLRANWALLSRASVNGSNAGAAWDSGVFVTASPLVVRALPHLDLW